MRKKRFAIACVVLLAGEIWMKNHGSTRSGTNDPVSSRTRPQGFGAAIASEAPAILRTKVANREKAGTRPTHAPERLKEFILPEVVIDGLTLDEALRKLIGIYEETCGKTGEIPLRLTFALPPGNARKLNLKLGPQSFNSSVRLLAAYSGMNVSRSRTAYQLQPFPDERKHVNQAIRVPPDFATRLSEQAGLSPEAGDPPPVRLPVVEILKASGFNFDSSTQMSLGESGILKLETSSSADAAVISALADTLGSEKPVQHKFTSQVVEIPAGTQWSPPDISQMTGDQVQSLMREIAGQQGAELTTLPSITGKSGQRANIEMIRELIVPTDDSGTTFEKHDIGKVVNITSNSLGFGHETNFGYTDTVGGLDETGKEITAVIKTDLADSGYTNDGDSRLVVQSRPDGSKTVLIVTAELIDATGRPLRR